MKKRVNEKKQKESKLCSTVTRRVPWVQALGDAPAICVSAAGPSPCCWGELHGAGMLCFLGWSAAAKSHNLFGIVALSAGG